jgi:hypothetical protein
MIKLFDMKLNSIIMYPVPRFGDIFGATLAFFLFPPALTVIGLCWVRWWAIRLPCIWIDETGNIR